MQIPRAGPDPVPLPGPEIAFRTLGLLARPAFTSTLCLPQTCGLHHSGCEAHFWLTISISLDPSPAFLSWQIIL